MSAIAADRSEINRFYTALFRNADIGGYVSLRTFEHDDGKPPVEIRAVQYSVVGLGPIIGQATGAANRAARFPRPAVLAPPPCTFTNDRRAAETDLHNGLAIVAECDDSPLAARARLTDILGSATIVVESGGLWVDAGTGELQPKLHLYLRLREPTRSGQDHARLKRTNRIVAALLGSDPTAVSLVHPLRLPGSVHRKGVPKLCRIVELNDECEIHLDDALKLLEHAATLKLEHAAAPDADRLRTALDIARGAHDARAAGPRDYDPDATDPDLEALADAIPNEDEPRGVWIQVGLGFYAASGGSPSGYNAWHRWSAKSGKAHGGTVDQWARFAKSPPTRTDKGALVQRARRTVPKFRLPSWGLEWSPTGHAATVSDSHRLGVTQDNSRPLIQIRGGGLAEHVRDAESALAAETARSPFTGMYARGSLLVRPIRLRDARSDGPFRRPVGALQLVPVDCDYARLEASRIARLQKFDQRSREWREVDAPESLARALLSAAPWTAMPHLLGVIEAPTLRPDGTLLDRPGFDGATGLLFDPGDTVFPAIAARPTGEAAETALKILCDVISDFSFADDESVPGTSRSVVIAAFITAVVRRALRAAPLFAFTAPKMASGKTLLATLAGYIASGRPPAMFAQVDDEESERKRLLALLLENAPIVVIDNIEKPLASATLCTILTEPMFGDRILGASCNVRVPTNTMFLATGNNLVIKGDLTTRALIAALDPGCERPEEREFDVNLHQAVPARRGELVAAALTIPLAYLAAGTPPQPVPPYGRFEDWSRWCRDPLVWLGMADPCASRHRIEARDTVGENLRALLRTWHDVFGSSEQSIASAVALQADGEKYVELREAIAAIAQQGREISTRRLGKFLSNNENRIEGGLRFVRAGTYAGLLRWQVKS